MKVLSKVGTILLIQCHEGKPALSVLDSHSTPEDSVQKPRAQFPALGVYHLLEFISRLLDPLPVIAVYHKDEALWGRKEAEGLTPT